MEKGPGVEPKRVVASKYELAFLRLLIDRLSDDGYEQVFLVTR